MKLQVLQDDLAKTLAVVSRFASSKVQLPVLANVLLTAKKNSLILSATNLEISVSLAVGAKIEEEGEITLPAKTFNDLVANLNKGQISLKTEKENLLLNTNGFDSLLTGMNVADYPSVPQNIGDSFLTVPQDKFDHSLSRVLFSVSVDESRPILTGVLFIFRKDQLALVSTDGFRLSQKLVNLPGSSLEKSVILPKNALSELVRISSGSKEIKFNHEEGEGRVIFGVNEGVVSSRTIEGEFPDFEKIIPKETTLNVHLDKEDFLRTIKLASVFARDSANIVKLTIKKDLLEISAESQRSGNQKTTLEAKVENDTGKDSFTIAYNFKFIEDFLNSVKGDTVILGFSDPNAPGVFTDPQDKDYLHIIMPVRLQS